MNFFDFWLKVWSFLAPKGGPHGSKNDQIFFVEILCSIDRARRDKQLSVRDHGSIRRFLVIFGQKQNRKIYPNLANFQWPVSPKFLHHTSLKKITHTLDFCLLSNGMVRFGPILQKFGAPGPFRNPLFAKKSKKCMSINPFFQIFSKRSLLLLLYGNIVLIL